MDDKELLTWLERMRDKLGLLSGFVYVLKAGAWYKIGKTNQLNKRIAQLTIQLPFPVEVVAVIHSWHCSGMERSLHECYSHCRTNGEWFELPDINHLLSLSAASAIRAPDSAHEQVRKLRHTIGLHDNNVFIRKVA